MARIRDVHEATAGFFLKHAAIGFALGVVVAGAMFATDAGGLRTLVGSADGAFAPIAVFVAQFGGLFAVVVAGAASPDCH